MSNYSELQESQKQKFEDMIKRLFVLLQSPNEAQAMTALAQIESMLTPFNLSRQNLVDLGCISKAELEEANTKILSLNQKLDDVLSNAKTERNNLPKSMKLFVNVSFTVEYTLEYGETWDMNTYAIALIPDDKKDVDINAIANTVKEALCPTELDFSAEIEEYKVLNDEEFSLMENLFPTYTINVTN